MSEPKIELATETTEVSTEPTSRLKSFQLNHPRTAKVVGVVAITAATLGAVQVWKSRRQIVETAEDVKSDVSDLFDSSSETA